VGSRAGLAGLALLLAMAAVIGVTWRQTRLRAAVHLLDTRPETLALAADAGFDTVVQLFSWRDIEPTEGQYHWQEPDEIVAGAEYYGLDLIVRLDQHPAWASDAPLSLNAPPDDVADFARFISAVATRYRGRVIAYVIWNEPNLAQDWGGQAPDPTTYVAMLHAAYGAVKEADPKALVVSAGLAPTNENSAAAMDDRLYLEAMYRAGAAPFFDVLGAHPYGFAYPPDDPAGAHEGLNMARLEDLRRVMVHYGDRATPVWATEAGWTTRPAEAAAWQRVTPPQQAEYLSAAFRRARLDWPWLHLLTVWNLGGEAHPDWGGYSLLEPDGTTKPAYRTLSALNRSDNSRRRAQGLALTIRRQAAQLRPEKSQVLASDAVVHLGDTDFSEPWMPLYGVRSPSTVWTGAAYVIAPHSRPWRLTLRVMQSNVWGNHIWVNGRRLTPQFPVGDFSGSWVSLTWDVPVGVLRAGPNEVRVEIGRTLPLIQASGFAWDDLQLKDIRLWQSNASGVAASAAPTDPAEPEGPAANSNPRQ
jgi:hypothetical protein